jgi:hypothetical protein
MGSVLPARKDFDNLIDTDFKSLRKYCDEVYGELTVLEDRRTKLQYALLQQTIDDPDRFEQMLTELQQHPHDNVLKLQRWMAARQDICSLAKRYWLIVEYHENSLEKEIQQRQELQNYFKKNDLLSLYYQFSSIVLHFRQRPSHLPISNKLIVLTRRFWLKVLEPEVHDRRSHVFFELPVSDDPDRANIFLAPEVLARLERRQPMEAEELNLTDKARVFTLGVCFLEQAMLTDCSTVYNFEAFQLDYDKLQELMHFTRNIYSEDIFSLLDQMLKYQPE